MKLSTDTVEKILDEDSVSPDIKEVLQIFLAAINDWPDQISSLEDFQLKIREFIKTAPNKPEIESAKKKINYQTQAWYGESLSQVLEVYRFYDKNIFLEQIVDDLRIKLKDIISNS